MLTTIFAYIGAFIVFCFCAMVLVCFVACMMNDEDDKCL